MFSSVIFAFEELTILSLFLYGLGRNKLVKSNKLFSTIKYSMKAIQAMQDENDLYVSNFMWYFLNSIRLQ